jgi:hypothetical protein
LNLLRATRLYGEIDCSQQIEDLILQNVRQRSWLIFYTHDIRSNPSQYGCTPELLKFAVSLAARSGSRILTVQEALAEAGVGKRKNSPTVLSGTGLGRKTSQESTLQVEAKA